MVLVAALPAQCDEYDLWKTVREDVDEFPHAVVLLRPFEDLLERHASSCTSSELAVAPVKLSGVTVIFGVYYVRRLIIGPFKMRLEHCPRCSVRRGERQRVPNRQFDTLLKRRGFCTVLVGRSYASE